jgi:glycosyltransferase involved in cell wall biosynthesis
MRVRLLSIVIPCFNARRWIVETVASALQSCGRDVEVIVIDDGSSDGSGDLVREAFPSVAVVTTENRGVSHARNLGISRAKGDAFVFLDADDVLLDGRLDRQTALLESSDAEIVYGDWQRLVAAADGRFVRDKVIARAIVGPPDVALFAGFWCPTGAYTFRRSIVEAVGGFSPALPVIQDAHFAIECALRGARFLHDPNVACLYRVHASDSVSTRNRVAFQRDCLASARLVCEWWAAHEGITEPRRRALVSAFEAIATTESERNDAVFHEACVNLERLARPGDPIGRASQRFVAKWLGQRLAHRLAHAARQTRARIRSAT